MSNTSATLLSLEEAAIAGAGIVGGKAYALALLARIGIVVPRSCILIVDRNAPFALDADIKARLSQMGLDDSRLAVRSSAIGEDGSDHSFAGIHASVLDVYGTSAIEEAVRTVAVSYESEAANAYRDRIGVPMGDGPIPVLLCEMVSSPNGPPVSAGVAFTCDPATGDLDSFVIELVAGLADELVQGAVTPERARISIRSGDIEAGSRFLRLLPEAHVRQLVRIMLRIEWALSQGDDEARFDIEWAFDGKQVVIVQARRVTSTGARDHVPSGPVWSQANLIEVLPGILSPLSWSFTRPGIRWTLREPYERAGHCSPGDLAMVKRIDGRPFIDIAALQWLSWTNFGILPAAINESLGGETHEIAIDDADTGLAEKARRSAGAMRLFGKLNRIKSTLGPRLDALRRMSNGITSMPKSGLSRDRLCAQWEGLAALSLDIPLGLAASAAVPWLTIAKQTLADHFDNARSNALIGGLMAGRRGTVSAEQALALAEIAASSNAGAKDAARGEFLATYGHRGFDELELENPRWSERPSDLDQLEHGYLDPVEIRERMAARRTAAKHDLATVPWPKRSIVKFLVKRIGDGFAIREEARSESVRALGAFRAIALEVGRRLCEVAKLDATTDVFYLTVPDLMAYLHGDWDGEGASDLVEDRKRQRREWQEMADPPHVVGGKRMRDPVAAPTRSLSGNVLRGLGVAPGVANGVARVVHDPGNIGAFDPGDILVSRATDPAWTPLFLKAGGLVVEHGGYLSHGAIIAREFGIPAVVNAKGAMRILEGDRSVSVDGSQGTVSFAN